MEPKPTPTDEARAADWHALTKRQRVAMLRKGNTLMTTSHARQQAVASQRRRAGGA